MQKKVFLINKDVAHRNLSLMDTWAIQQGYVVATEGYMEEVFQEMGVIPNLYLYTTEPPSCFNNTLVRCVKYDGRFEDGINTVYRLLFTQEEFIKESTKAAKNLKDFVATMYKPVSPEEYLLHISVLGTTSLTEAVKRRDFLQQLEKWNALNIGISIAFEGSTATPHTVIPMWKPYDKTKETSQVIATSTPSEVQYVYTATAGSQNVPLPEYLRRWNTCLTCPFLEYYEGSARCTHCGCAQKSKCSWNAAECSDPKTRRW